MNLFQRFFQFWRSLWAAGRGLDAGRIAPLPPLLTDPTGAYAGLMAEAEARGTADGRSAMSDPWSFGGPGDQASAGFDPDYVKGLRNRRELEVASLHAAQRLTDDRVAAVRRRRDECREQMADARAKMTGLAAVEEQARMRGLEDPAPDPDPAVPADPRPEAGDTPWEGESNPLPLPWRLLILAGLVTVELVVQLSVFSHFLARNPGDADLARWLSGATAAIVVLGPFVAGTVLRTRPATGTDRRMGYTIIAIAVGWLAASGTLGLVRGRVFEAGAAQPDTAHVTFVTLALMFLALSLVVGAMAFMLGLARRHPYQEAYVRYRTRGDHFETLMWRIAARINPTYVDPQNGSATADQQVRAIEAAYAAAENVYFAALVRAHGDPAFTEAVQHRRGLGAAA